MIELQSKILDVFLRVKVDIHFSISLQKPAPHDNRRAAEPYIYPLAG